MIPPAIEGNCVGLGVTQKGALEILQSRAHGSPRFEQIAFLNIGLEPGETPNPDLRESLADAGMWSVLHAVDINFGDQLAASRIQALQRAVDSLQPRWLEEDLGTWVWSEAFLAAHQLEPVLTQESAIRSAATVKRIAQATGRPFLVENPPVYLAIGEHDMWTHLAQVATACDCALVIDVGHMIGAHLNADLPMRIPGLEWSGWARVRELHFSGFEVQELEGRWVWNDRHDLPFPDLLLQWGSAILDAVPQPVVVTLELDGATPAILDDNLAKILAMIRAKSRVVYA